MTRGRTLQLVSSYVVAAAHGDGAELRHARQRRHERRQRHRRRVPAGRSARRWKRPTCAVDVHGPAQPELLARRLLGPVPAELCRAPEVWFVRCAPVGSIGKPLKHGELRQVSVLVRESETSKNSVVTNIKLWRRPRDDRCSQATSTCGSGIAGWATLRPHRRRVACGIHIFERRWNGTSHVTLPVRRDHHALHGDALAPAHRAVMMTHYVLASSHDRDEPVDTPTQPHLRDCYKEPEWESACTRSRLHVQAHVHASTCPA